MQLVAPSTEYEPLAHAAQEVLPFDALPAVHGEQPLPFGALPPEQFSRAVPIVPVDTFPAASTAQSRNA